ncbi:UDP-N-acetylmuramate--L-alanine ligase [Synechococcus elongatus]|uniref:UDP-N-acetylmuramate--L-alanine ligase n=1 Tax=Synechococcus elongatus PCC 11802 TaxID=2283154 RepID=A0AAU6R4W3_SYNEL|nr:UDP-N-acetylmuramate--L-alanine ligase [Synechococcus elongatus]QFZ92283.1 UDP-N-acetylmuramate--L-alanine ligase [Synechococcus elongatus PCC 11802]
MTIAVDLEGRPFHFIGIGGIGMSALAQVVTERQLPVSGSDIRRSHITDRLADLGAQIFDRQDATNLAFFQEAVSAGQSPQVICSTAIHAHNEEYQAAIDLGCPVFHRSDLLAALLRVYEGIAVAGTHGKTTTSGLISYLLYQAGLDPTVVIGGEVNALGGNARLGQSQYLVAEADESDGSLVKLQAAIGIITNIELDHPDHYCDLEAVIETFQTFSNNCTQLVANWDCPTVRDRIPGTISYSLDPARGADYTVDQISFRGSGTQARVWERGEILGLIHLPLLEAHNLSNALAAIAACRHLGMDFASIREGLAGFEGARRRFEFRGSAQGIQFVDDYAHHPSELAATLAAARLQIDSGCSRLPEVPKRLVAIFQPHRYSRTQAFLAEFAQSFGPADLVLISDIYAAGERNPGQLSGQTLADAIAQYQDNVHYAPDLDAIETALHKLLQPGDLALFLGAGNLNQVIPRLLEFYACDRSAA